MKDWFYEQLAMYTAYEPVRNFVFMSASAENGGDKLVHGSGGNVPAAGGAKVCHL